MSTTLEPESNQDIETGERQTAEAVQRMRTDFAACRLKFQWLGISKSLSESQKSQAAESFGAEGKSISAGKKLFDTTHEAYRSLTSLRSQITTYWKDRSLAYTEPGVRLIRQDRIENFNVAMRRFKEDLEAGVDVLEGYFLEIKEAARIRLGGLYDASDYPSSLENEFSIEWEFPSIDAPDYLRRLNPALYQEQSRLVAERFQQAADMAEQAFTGELEKLVTHLSERLSADEDGKPKIFRDSAVSNLGDFFRKFSELNLGSSEALDQLVAQCEGLMSGVEPDRLRNSESLRRSLATKLSSVQSSLDQLIVERPKRNILRKNRSSSNNGGA